MPVQVQFPHDRHGTVVSQIFGNYCHRHQVERIKYGDYDYARDRQNHSRTTQIYLVSFAVTVMGKEQQRRQRDEPNVNNGHQ